MTAASPGRIEPGASAPGEPRPARPRPARALLHWGLDAVMALAGALVLAVALALARAAWLGLRGDGPEGGGLSAALAAPGPLFGIATAVVSLGLPALVLAWLRRPALPQTGALAAWRTPSTWLWSAAIGCAMFALSALALTGLRRAGIEVSPSNQALVAAAARDHPFVLVAFAVGLAPLYEELLFRRVLFARLWAAGLPGVGIALSGLLFALFHEPPLLSGQPAAASAVLWLAYGTMGAAFAWVYRHTGTLWAAIGAHAVNNALGCAALFLTAA